MTSVSKPQKVHIGIMALPLNKSGQFLITKRNEPKFPPAHHKWQITGGGMEFGETPEQTLTREFQEELSVTPKILYPHPILKTYLWDYQDHQSHILLACYVVDIGNQSPKVDGFENIAYKWIPPQDIHHLDFLPLCDEIISEAQQIVQEKNLLSLL